MINFKKITVDDKDWINPLLKSSNYSGCHHNFGNLLAWADINKTLVAKVNDYLVVKAEMSNGEKGYFYPAGFGDKKAVIEEMIKDSLQSNQTMVFLGLSPEDKQELDEFFPDKFIYEEYRDEFDYVYLIEKLVSLSGKKLHAKRNHINVFKKNNQWTFEQITADKLKECWEMNEKWCIEQECKDDESLTQENCATQVFFDNFEEIGLEGGIIRVDGNIVAFTLGEKLNSDTYVIHIEKAFKSIQGAYPMINREFADWVNQNHPEIVYVNREEDMGLDGLRKAKLSYYPVKMEEKLRAYYK